MTKENEELADLAKIDRDVVAWELWFIDKLVKELKPGQWILKEHLNRVRQEKQGEIHRLNNRTHHLKQRCHRMTDHAFVRYLERVLGFDVDSLKTKILGRELSRDTLETRGMIQSGEFFFVVDGSKIVTVLTREMAEKSALEVHYEK